ncbi:hypothetical protein AVEN_46022-1 [Araneus ventricosus]|uniref:Uncharacterized protein n=1 Tax=Araneus ventricosus TaxID=182803 RepID=A0A4Y2M324_ARAVE|nr:hypothetical protein AVEN_46022-1 [Araneus ventricosus]
MSLKQCDFCHPGYSVSALLILQQYHCFYTSFFVSIQTEMRPRWPRVNVPASEQEAPRWRPDSNKDPSCNGPVAHQIVRMQPNVLPLVWCGSLERAASSGVVLVICQRFKMTKSVPK